MCFKCYCRGLTLARQTPRLRISPVPMYSDDALGMHPSHVQISGWRTDFRGWFDIWWRLPMCQTSCGIDLRCRGRLHVHDRVPALVRRIL
mmetsp:Transcript_16110/g.36994  ORF Transcript_16110/g.36994 Transcript_16110/m.36994 type:complete len:90 (-) Transcript_16110:51-320(-)